MFILGEFFTNSFGHPVRQPPFISSFEIVSRVVVGPSDRKLLKKKTLPIFRQSTSADGSREGRAGSTGGGGGWLLNAKSEGDDPDCISHEISQVRFDRGTRTHELKSGLPGDVCPYQKSQYWYILESLEAGNIL
jgi:hypothetical protein